MLTKNVCHVTRNVSCYKECHVTRNAQCSKECVMLQGMCIMLTMNVCHAYKEFWSCYKEFVMLH